MMVSVPWLEIPKLPMRSRKKLAGDWSFGDDGGDIFPYLYLINVHFPYSGKNNLMPQNTFGVKKAWPSKVESYLEVNSYMSRLATT